MKLSVTLVAATAIAWITPGTAHHMSPMDPELPENALDIHSAAIESVQELMEYLAADGVLVRVNDGQEMDPVDAQMSGGMCDTNYTTGLPDCEAGPGGVMGWGAGSVQSGGGVP